MRRVALSTIGVALVALLALAGVASAAVPTVGSVSATNIQGVSAMLKGSVNPQGLATTYSFEYVDDDTFNATGFAGAPTTPVTAAGQGSSPHPAQAAIEGLKPGTTYHVRLQAGNSSGPATAEGTFTTTAGFGFLPGAEGFGVRAIADGGGAASEAGSHPYRLSIGLGFNKGGEFEGQPGAEFPDGDLRDLSVVMPPGMILNPSVLPMCPASSFARTRTSPFEVSLSGESCPDETQVGTVDVETSRGSGEVRRFGLFNLEPPPGVAAQLGFAPFGSPVVLEVTLHEDGGGAYSMTFRARNIPQSLDINSLAMNVWGIPWAASHDGERGNCLNESEPIFPWAKCSVGSAESFHAPASFLSLPTRCSGKLPFHAAATSWQQPAVKTADDFSHDSGGVPTELGSCGKIPFEPTSEGLLTDQKASSPSGYNFRLQNEDIGLTSVNQPTAPPIKKAVVRLPPGVSVNPSVGAGLGTCSPAQYAAETVFSEPGAGCPNGSKLGDFSVRTPLFDELFEGSIYLATPNDVSTQAPGAENPFDALVSVYLVAKAPERGIQVKLAGLIAPDPKTGDVIATFDGLPQLPYTDLNINFRTGQRAFLVTPPGCGTFKTEVDATPWAEGQPSTHSTSSSDITSGVGAGPCPPSGPPPFAPGATAGAINSNVGSYTPYFVHLTRRDNEQEITSYSLVLPKGITGKLAGVPFCPEADIERSRTKQGAVETAEPSCPAASQVGRTLTGYGVGSALTYAPGRVYLAGPYHGAPLSLVTVNSATVGPFDLGTIVIRSAFQVNPETAQLEIDSHGSDPIPHIIDGIPLHLRDIRIYIDRYQFTHNPSSCEASALVSTLTGSGTTFSDSSDDSSASVSKHFQLLNCLTLGFKPKLGIRLRGGSKRGDYPQLRATFAGRGPGDSNLKRIEVTMPHSEFLAQEHIQSICTNVQFNAEQCPADSVYGHAVAYTPLFDEPLRGNVYLRSSQHRLPDLVASLRSGAVRITLQGKIGPAKQGIRALFDKVPDAPIERFVMTLDGGSNGLLVNSANICTAPPTATVKALGQNNIGAAFTTVLRGQCKGKGKKKGDKARSTKRTGEGR